MRRALGRRRCVEVVRTGEKLALRRLEREMGAKLPVGAGDLVVVDKVGRHANANEAAEGPSEGQAASILRLGGEARAHEASVPSNGAGYGLTEMSNEAGGGARRGKQGERGVESERRPSRRVLLDALT